jgi:hypothetical protein
MKLVVVNLAKEVNNLHNKNYKILMKETEENTKSL